MRRMGWWAIWAAGAVAGAAAVGASVAQPDADPAPSLGPRLMTAAGAFEAYTGRAAAVNAAFTSGEAVHEGLREAAPPEESALVEGMIAYGALAALGESGFVQAARDAAQNEGAGFAETLARSPYSAMEIPGAQEAAERVEQALGVRAGAISVAGAAVKQAAYSIQHQAWSKLKVADAAGRLAEVKALSAAPLAPLADEDERVRASLTTYGSADDGGSGVVTPVVVDAVALAALAAAGPGWDEDQMVVDAVTREPASAECLKLARLDLYQCMAVAGPQYEDVFCLGEHALGETGACLIKSSGRLQSSVQASRDALGALLNRDGLGASRPADWPAYPPAPRYSSSDGY